MAAQLDITLRRNEDWARRLVLTADGEPIDLSGMSAAMQIRSKLEQDLVDTASVTITDPLTGEIAVLLKASEGSPLSAYGSPIQTAELFYDFRLTDADGLHVDLFCGRIILLRGETRA